MFYDMGHRLANGFVRNGHFVFTMNDRDSRKQCLGVWPAAVWHANRRLLYLARELQPNLLCLHHCDLIRSETVHRIREMVPGCRVAVVYYDGVQLPSSARRLRRFLEAADFGFVTSAGPAVSALAETCPIAYIPNPIDLSIDNVSAFAVARKSFDVFCAAGGTGRENRWALIDELRRRSPKLRYALHGRDKKLRLLGDAYYRVIEQSKVGLNLNGHEGGLYASDRMAQYLGSGLLLATSRRSGYQRYFNDDEMIFFQDVAELASKVEWAIADDRRWRKMAERARAKAMTTMGGQLVTDFILRMTHGMDEPKGWQFSNEIHTRVCQPQAAQQKVQEHRGFPCPV
jgi:hypothetical protein